MRWNLVLITVVSTVGALLCVYESGFFLVRPEGGRKSCILDRTRDDWLVFLAFLSLDIYVGPNVLSLGLAVGLLVRLCAERRRRERLFFIGIRIGYIKFLEKCKNFSI